MNIIPYMIRNEQISKHPFAWERKIAKISEKRKQQKTLPFGYNYVSIFIVLSLSCVQLSATPWTAEWKASLSFTISQRLFELMSTESVMPSNHLILCHPLLLPSIFPASGSFPMSQLFASGGQSIGASASESVAQMKIQHWFLLGLAGLSSLQSKGLSIVFLNTTVQKHQFFSTRPSLWSSSHDYWKDHRPDYMVLCWQSDVFAF